MSPQLFRKLLFTAFLAGLLHAVPLQAGETTGFCWGIPRWLGVSCGCCPDDYCVKPLPAVQCPPPQCCPNDYCKKPLPAIPCTNCEKSCDCYDCKPLPAAPRCCEPWYKCIPFCGGK